MTIVRPFYTLLALVQYELRDTFPTKLKREREMASPSQYCTPCVLIISRFWTIKQLRDSTIWAIPSTPMNAKFACSHYESEWMVVQKWLQSEEGDDREGLMTSTDAGLLHLPSVTLLCLWKSFLHITYGYLTDILHHCVTKIEVDLIHFCPL